MNCIQPTKQRNIAGNNALFLPVAAIQLTICLLFTVLLSTTSPAQTSFLATSLPSQPGECNYSYFSSNVDVTSFLALDTSAPPGMPGGAGAMPQYWDFSQPQQPYETVLQVNIVPAANGGDSEYFQSATYAEMDTMATNNIIGWQYYGFTSSGRVCYGLDEPVAGASPEAVLAPACVDIPSTVQLNQTWSNQLYWMTLYYQFILVSNYMSYSAVVDAYGTLILPQIGSVPALRVHETHSYAISEVSLTPILLDISTNEYYYWLVPNLGVAAQVTLLGNNALYPAAMPYTNTVVRMFSANYFTNTSVTTSTNSSSNSVPVPGDLSIQNTGASIVLNWLAFTNCASYRVDFAPCLPPSWQSLGYTTDTCWTDSIGPIQGWYRVVGSP